MSTAPAIPRGTYRLQFNAGFTLRDARAQVPYLHDLGVSHIYASPLLKAQPGSTHGYDVCDFSQLNPEVGTESDLADLAETLHQHGMGLVLDIVPNHMGVGGPQNLWWWDLLLRGADSPYAGYFDVQWDWRDPRLRGKVLAPVLGDRYQRVLGKGEIQLGCESGAFAIHYFDHRFPVNLRSLALLLERAAAQSSSSELRQLAEQLANAPAAPPPSLQGEPNTVPDSHSLALQLDQLARREPAVAEALASVLRELNANPDALDALIQQQHYKLTYWRHGDTELNYRRFFNIITLAGLRTELSQVFEDVHARVFRWLERGWVDGLRIDHVDGLRDPQAYLDRLRASAPGAWIVIEKILEHGEQLPASWPVAGTTGYDFLTRMAGLFVDSTGEQPLTDFYREFTGEPTDYPSVSRAKNRLVLRDLLRAEVNRLLWPLLHVANLHWRVRDFTVDEFRDALIEVIACLPVYRTYARPPTGEISAADAAWVDEALATARRERSQLDPAVLDFLGDLLHLRLTGEIEGEFVCRFQQTSGPAMAKGVEDTAFYCYNRLVALNVVGGDPGRFGVSAAEFHAACVDAQAHWPHTMLTTSTHDTKRSEDVRARISLLAEMPSEWADTVRRWAALNECHRHDGFPDRNTEYLYYQTLVGAWPIEMPRILAYMEKAVCEAKVHTTWTRRSETYHAALNAFVTDTFSDPTFTVDLDRFVARLLEPGHVNSLAQTLLKLTAPGVPDIYQGTELWDWSLVDPDNRRPVDFALRARLLADLDNVSAEEAWQRRGEGLPKLWLIRKALEFRRNHPELFGAQGGYQPVGAQGCKAEHVIAFARMRDKQAALAVVPRWPIRLGEGKDRSGSGEVWQDTEILLPNDCARATWHNVLTGVQVTGRRDGEVVALPLREMLAVFPVALLEPAGP